MRRSVLIVLMMLIAAIGSGGAESESSPPPLVVGRTIPLPGVSGGFNHLGADAEQKHLFLTATHDAKLDVLDLTSGKIVRQIEGSSPAAATYAPDLHQVLVTRGSKLYIYDGKTFDESGQVDIGSSMDELHYDAGTHRVYLGCMSAGEMAIAEADVASRKLVGKMKLPGKPQGFSIEAKGSKIFVNVPSQNAVIVLDREKRSLVEQWSLGDVKGNYPMGLDERHQRLFIGCRRPAKLLVLDTSNGKTIGSADIVSDCDDLSYDESGARIYVCGGEGGVSVIEQKDSDHYNLLGNVSTGPGARNCILLPELRMFYVAVPQREKQPAEVREYDLRATKK